MKPIVNKYVVEVPWLEGLLDEDTLVEKYEKESFDEFDEGDKNHVLAGRHSWSGSGWIRFESDEPITRVLFDKIDRSTQWKEPFGWFIHKYDIKMQTAIHTDKDRNAVLIYPIIPKAYTIVYMNEDKSKEVHRHTYRCPTIINATIPHYVEDANFKKIHFQISLFIKIDDWSKVFVEH